MKTFQDVTDHGQGKHLNEVVELAGHVMKITVHHDTSYAKQSYAKIELFQPDFTWSPLLTLDYGVRDWAKDRAFGLKFARDLLVERAVGLLS